MPGNHVPIKDVLAFDAADPANDPPENKTKTIVVIMGRTHIKDRAWACSTADDAIRLMRWLGDNKITCCRMSPEAFRFYCRKKKE